MPQYTKTLQGRRTVQLQLQSQCRLQSGRQMARASATVPPFSRLSLLLIIREYRILLI